MSTCVCTVCICVVPYKQIFSLTATYNYSFLITLQPGQHYPGLPPGGSHGCPLPLPLIKIVGPNTRNTQLVPSPHINIPISNAPCTHSLFLLNVTRGSPGSKIGGWQQLEVSWHLPSPLPCMPSFSSGVPGSYLSAPDIGNKAKYDRRILLLNSGWRKLHVKWVPSPAEAQDRWEKDATQWHQWAQRTEAEHQGLIHQARVCRHLDQELANI